MSIKCKSKLFAKNKNFLLKKNLSMFLNLRVLLSERRMMITRTERILRKRVVLNVGGVLHFRDEVCPRWIKLPLRTTIRLNAMPRLGGRWHVNIENCRCAVNADVREVTNGEQC